MGTLSKAFSKSNKSVGILIHIVQWFINIIVSHLTAQNSTLCFLLLFVVGYRGGKWITYTHYVVVTREVTCSMIIVSIIFKGINIHFWWKNYCSTINVIFYDYFFGVFKKSQTFTQIFCNKRHTVRTNPYVFTW